MQNISFKINLTQLSSLCYITNRLFILLKQQSISLDAIEVNNIINLQNKLLTRAIAWNNRNAVKLYSLSLNVNEYYFLSISFEKCNMHFSHYENNLMDIFNTKFQQELLNKTYILIR
jgi:hypothetical protein